MFPIFKRVFEPSVSFFSSVPVDTAWGVMLTRSKSFWQITLNGVKVCGVKGYHPVCPPGFVCIKYVIQFIFHFRCFCFSFGDFN